MKKLTKKAIRAELLKSLFDPKYSPAFQVIIGMASPTYNMRKSIELIHEALNAIDYKTTNEKLEQAISVLALTKAANNETVQSKTHNKDRTRS